MEKSFTFTFRTLLVNRKHFACKNNFFICYCVRQGNQQRGIMCNDAYLREHTTEIDKFTNLNVTMFIKNILSCVNNVQARWLCLFIVHYTHWVQLKRHRLWLSLSNNYTVFVE